MNQRENQELYRDLAKQIHAGIRNTATYPTDHPVCEQVIRKSFQILKGILRNQGAITLGVSDDRVFIDDAPLDFPSSFTRSLVREFRQKSIDSVTFVDTLSMKDLITFFTAMKPGDPNHKDNLASALVEKGVSSVKFNEIKYGRIRTQGGDQSPPEVFALNGEGKTSEKAHEEPVHASGTGEIQAFSKELIQELSDPFDKARKKACQRVLDLISSPKGNEVLAKNFLEISNAFLGRVEKEDDLSVLTSV